MPSRSTSRRGAMPKTITPTQFERVVTFGSRLAMVMVGALAFAVALVLGKPILAPLSLAIVAGLVFGPVADRLERRGIVPALSAGVVVIGFIAVLAAATYLFAAPLSDWVARGPVLWSKLQAQLAGLKEPLQTLGAVQDQLKQLMGGGAAMTVQVQDGGPVTDVALMAPSILADVLLFLAGLYFFLATRHQIRIAVLSLCFSRRTRWRTAHIFRDVELKVSRFMLSAAAINGGVGVVTALAMWALGMPSPLLWGGLAAVLNFIPYVGQALMFAILFAVGLGTHSDLVGIVLPVVTYAAINLAADQVVFPHLIGKAMTLNPFIIFVSIAFWIWVWGPVGGFVAVPSLLVLQSLILHIFPTTAAIPERAKRKLEEAKAATEEAKAATDEAKAAAEVANSAVAAAAEVAVAPAVVAPKPKRAARKPAVPAAP